VSEPAITQLSREETAQAVKDGVKEAIPLTRKETAQAVKDGIKEWMDDNILAFGRWTVRGLIVAGFGAIVWLILQAHGFKLS
jgi:hypothetical protein